MIRVELRIDSFGCVSSLTSVGHAEPVGGVSAVCAAATVLVRTSARCLSAVHGVTIGGTAREPGEMRYRVSVHDNSARERIAGMTEFLRRGLSDIRDDAPTELELREITEGDGDGT